MNVLVDFALKIGSKLVEDKTHDAIRKAQLKERLNSYLSQQQSLNFHISTDEEVDLEGLSEYICTDLIRDVEQRLLGSKKERAAARKRILNKTVSFASAHTNLSTRRTLKIVDSAIDTIINFYRKKVNRDLLLITGEIEEVVTDEHKKTRDIIAQEAEHVKSIIKDSAYLSIDRDLRLMEEGKLSEIEKRLGTYVDSISTTHSLFPFFGYKMTTDNKLISVPLNEKAKIQYPENYKIVASDVMLGDQPVYPGDQTFFDRAYRHQEPISFKVLDIQKYLGDVLDPAQSNVQEMVGNQAMIKPPEFPPAFPCSVKIGSETVVPYLLFRTKEILDDGTVVITNEEQKNYNFTVSISFPKPNGQLLKGHSLTITVNKPTNLEFLNYLMFLKRVASGECITLFSLNLNKELVQGEFEESDSTNLDTLIDLYQKITSIESYYNTTFSFQEPITENDLRIIIFVFEMIHDGYSCESDHLIECYITISDEAREFILKLTEQDYLISINVKEQISLFNQTIDISSVQEIDCVRVDNLSRLKEKTSALDNGEQVKVSFIPGAGKERYKLLCKSNNEDQSENKLYIRVKEELGNAPKGST